MPNHPRGLGHGITGNPTSRDFFSSLLERCNSEMSVTMRAFDENEEGFSVELAKVEGYLRTLATQSRSVAARRAKSILKLGKPLKRDPWFRRALTKEQRLKQARSVYAELNGLIEDLNHLAAEQRIGG